MPFIGQSLPASKSLAHDPQVPCKPHERTLVMLIWEPLVSAAPTQTSSAGLALPSGLRHAGHLGNPFFASSFHLRRCHVFGMRGQIPVVSERVDHFAETISPKHV